MLNSRKYLRGCWGERIWLAMLFYFGWSALAACDYSGPDGERAPRLRGTCEITVPDLDAAKEGVRTSIDSKVKERANPRKDRGEKEHCAERCHVIAYRKFERLYGVPVIIGVLEEDTGALLANTLTGLGEGFPSNQPHVWDVINWPRSKFRLIAELSPNRIHKLMYLRDGQVRRPQPKFDATYLSRLADFLRPRQLELPLLHFDVLARAGRPV